MNFLASNDKRRWLCVVNCKDRVEVVVAYFKLLLKHLVGIKRVRHEGPGVRTTAAA